MDDSGIRNSHFGHGYPGIWTGYSAFLAFGYHWYKWMDNPMLEGKAFSRDNCGLLNQNDEPYEPFFLFVREVNRRVESGHAFGVV